MTVTYETVQKAIEHQMERLRRSLDIHRANHDASPHKWSLGDLAMVREQLTDILDFIAGSQNFKQTIGKRKG
jgi:hypothetical protein